MAVFAGDGLDIWVAVGGRSVGVEVSVGLGSVGDAGLSDGIDRRVGDGAAGGSTCDGFTVKFKPALITARVIANAAITLSQPNPFLGGNPNIMKVNTAKIAARPR